MSCDWMFQMEEIESGGGESESPGYEGMFQVEEGLLERAIWHLAESLHPHHFLLSQVIIVGSFKQLCNKTGCNGA